MSIDFVAPVKLVDKFAIPCDSLPHRLDLGVWVPPREALTFSQLYLNIRYQLKDAARPGRLRVFMRRHAFAGEPIDDTFFHDVDLAPGYGTKLHTFCAYESAEKGRPLSWWAQAYGCEEASLSTRFTKRLQVW